MSVKEKISIPLQPKAPAMRIAYVFISHKCIPITFKHCIHQIKFVI